MAGFWQKWFTGSLPSEICLLGKGSHFTGHVQFEGLLRIDGFVAGNVLAQTQAGATLIVGENAIIEGDVLADSVVINGAVKGKVQANRYIEIHHRGKLLGDIKTGSLMIEPGGVFEGACCMTLPI